MDWWQLELDRHFFVTAPFLEQSELVELEPPVWPAVVVVAVLATEFAAAEHWPAVLLYTQGSYQPDVRVQVA